jgi:uncharacterized protein YdhG (YjbR/CyaY superfamily)
MGNYTPEVDTYIAQFPAQVQEQLQIIRNTIINAAPLAKEIISYKMPAYKQEKMLVYFAGYKNHIGFYPTASGIEAFKHKFSMYKWSKGAVQFPVDKPLPLNLITEIVKFKITEDSLK